MSFSKVRVTCNSLIIRTRKEFSTELGERLKSSQIAAFAPPAGSVCAEDGEPNLSIEKMKRMRGVCPPLQLSLFQHGRHCRTEEGQHQHNFRSLQLMNLLSLILILSVFGVSSLLLDIIPRPIKAREANGTCQLQKSDQFREEKGGAGVKSDQSRRHFPRQCHHGEKRDQASAYLWFSRLYSESALHP